MPKGARIFDPDRFKKARLEAGLTQDDFADVGIQQSQISNYERKISEPSPDTAKTLALKLNVSLGYLFGEVDNPNIKPSESDLSDNLLLLEELIDVLGVDLVKEVIDKRSV